MSGNLLYQKTLVSTRDEGDKVVLQIGNSEMTMGYEAAFQLSQWLRISAKKAKRNAGDVSRHYSAIAIVRDAEETLKEAQSRR